MSAQNCRPPFRGDPGPRLIYSLSGPPESTRQRHLDLFSRFCRGGSPMCSTHRYKTTVTRTAMRRSVTIDRILCYARPVLVVCPSELRQLHGLRHIQQPQWLGSRVVSVLDSGAKGPRFKSQPRRCRVTGLGKLFTPIVPLFTKQRNW